MAVISERRSEPRTLVHQPWNVRIESRLFTHRLAQVVDYSLSGMRLVLDGEWVLQPGDQVDINYIGTSFACSTAVCWSSKTNGQTEIGVQLLNDSLPVHQVA